MMIAHKVIDALLERGHRYRMMTDVPGGVPDKARCQKIARLIEAAQMFDFGVLPFELSRDKNGVGEWLLPTLTDDERTAWQGGLFPLPYQSCWYEFGLGIYRSGLLLLEPENGDTLFVQRFDMVGDALCCDGIMVSMSRMQPVPDQIQIRMNGNSELVELLENAGTLAHQVGVSGPLGIYLTMMLHSRTTEISAQQEPPKFLNRKRIKKGLTPLPAHRIVHIVPHHYREHAEKEARTERRLPRLHWRRTHLRHYDHQTGNSKYHPTVVHNGKEGWWITVIARMLVGKAELGSLTHEYKIDEPKEHHEHCATAA